MPATQFVLGDMGEFTGNLYISSSPIGVSEYEVWRAPPRPGATPTRIASGLVGFVEESPTHAYFDDGISRFRVAHTSVVREPVPRVAEDCGFHEWVSANEYRCLRFDGVHRLNLLTGADTLEFPESRWSSIGSAAALARNGVILVGGARTDTTVGEFAVSDTYFYSYTGEVRYVFAAANFSRDPSGRAVGTFTDIFRDSHLLIADPSTGGHICWLREAHVQGRQ